MEKHVYKTILLFNLVIKRIRRIRRPAMSEKIELKNKTVLVTGAAGFIGSNLALELLKSYRNIVRVR